MGKQLLHAKQYWDDMYKNVRNRYDTKTLTRIRKAISECTRRLCSGEPLESKYRDHELGTNNRTLKGLREYHVMHTPDICIVYSINKDENTVTYKRIGRHVELGLVKESINSLRDAIDILF